MSTFFNFFILSLPYFVFFWLLSATLILIALFGKHKIQDPSRFQKATFFCSLSLVLFTIIGVLTYHFTRESLRYSANEYTLIHTLFSTHLAASLFGLIPLANAARMLILSLILNPVLPLTRRTPQHLSRPKNKCTEDSKNEIPEETKSPEETPANT